MSDLTPAPEGAIEEALKSLESFALGHAGTEAEIEAARAELRATRERLAEAERLLRDCARVMRVPVEDGGEMWRDALNASISYLVLHPNPPRPAQQARGETPG